MPLSKERTVSFTGLIGSMSMLMLMLVSIVSCSGMSRELRLRDAAREETRRGTIDKCVNQGGDWIEDRCVLREP